jgi:hypothetical protein
MYKNKIKSLINVGWSRVALWDTFFKKESKSFVRKNKAIKNIPIDVDLMRLIIVKLTLECFDGIYWNFILYKVR